MLYNTEQKKICSKVDCQTCRCFDRHLKKCEGFQKVCFLYDEKTQTCIDVTTGLPIKIN